MLRRLRGRFVDGGHITFIRERMSGRIAEWERMRLVSSVAAGELRSCVLKIPHDSWFGHFASHLCITLFLRFPLLGPLGRFLWTSLSFLRAFGRRHADPEGYVRARRAHTLVVFCIAPIPYGGLFAYLCSREAWRSNPLITLVLLDVVLLGVPSRIYAAVRDGIACLPCTLL